MKSPLQITIHNIPHADDLESIVRKHAEKLEEFVDHIMSCHIVVDVPHRHHKTGNLYQVRIDIKVPHDEIAVSTEPSARMSAKDVHVAIRDAFDAAKRQLEDYVRRMRGDVKRHTGLPHACIAQLMPVGRYGFLQTPDGREIYFHENSLIDADFNDLAVGQEMVFVEEAGEKGPQASTLKPAPRYHHV
jgi:cold shock CspA family protein/ribosome-associated translation inhibitor RaiA